MAYFSVIFFFLCLLQQIEAQEAKVCEKGPVHEAFLTQESPTPILQAISNEPPSPITERIPRKVDMQAVWIPGYWEWMPDRKDFIWITGVWRRPPPGHQWISGSWESHEESWVRIPGFWSETSSLTYIEKPPPDPVEEEVNLPEKAKVFWVPGYWKWSHQTKDYAWVPGSWAKSDSEWILVPSHYVWKEEGYVFVPAYWDWPLEVRGTAYACWSIAKELRDKFILQPLKVVENKEIVDYFFLRYPDYRTFFFHHFQFHPEYWREFCCVPPWWGWNAWWTLTLNHQWALWWWYTHPGYPQPEWLKSDQSNSIPPPVQELLAGFEVVNSPPFVTSRGVVGYSDLIKAIENTTEKKVPILPANSEQKNEVFLFAKPLSVDPMSVLKPTGSRLPIDPKAVRPRIPKPIVSPGVTPKSVMPEKDRLPIPEKPRIPSNPRPKIWKEA